MGREDAALENGVAYVQERSARRRRRAKPRRLRALIHGRHVRERARLSRRCQEFARSPVDIGPKAVGAETGATSLHPRDYRRSPSSAGGVGAEAAHEGPDRVAVGQESADVARRYSLGMPSCGLMRHPAPSRRVKRLGWKQSFETFIQDGGVTEVVRR